MPLQAPRRIGSPGHTAGLVLGLLAACLPPTADALTVRVRAKDGTSIQRAIDRLPAMGGTVVISAKDTIPVSEPIVIDRDNVTLTGEGRSATVLRLADHANAPVIVVGGTAAAPTTTRRSIVVRDLTIDGNRQNQDWELSPANPALRNNGVSLRRVESTCIENVTVFGCRSGGLVTELGCRRVTIRSVESSDNAFDGLAAYETTDSLFTGLYLHDNLAAGISCDLDAVGNLVSNVVIADTGSVGIFLRDSRGNAFTGLVIRDSAQHGVFLAQVDTDATTPAANNSFTGCVISACGGAAVRANDASCVGNVLCGCNLFGNAGGALSEAVPGLLVVSGTATD